MSKNRKFNRQNRPEFTADVTDDTSWELESKLEPGMLRFLAHVIEDGLQCGLRSNADFIRHFPPLTIMTGLAERPDLRANILVPTTGVRPKIAQRKAAESAGEDLQIALNEGETDADTIVSLFHPDDRVRYLDKARIWNFISEPKFWTCKSDQGEQFNRAKSHLAFILDRAIEDGMLTYRDIVDGITVATMVQYLPLTELQAVIEKALSNSHANQAFTEENMLDVVPSTTITEHVPLSIIWDRVISPKVAVHNNLVNADAAPSLNGHGSVSEYHSEQPGISSGVQDHETIGS
jgi:hypothetical protein